MEKRLLIALAAYVFIIAVCCKVLSGKILLAVLIILGGLIAKTLIAWKAGW